MTHAYERTWASECRSRRRDKRIAAALLLLCAMIAGGTIVAIAWAWL